MRVTLLSALLIVSGCAFDSSGLPGDEPAPSAEPDPGDAVSPPSSDPDPGQDPSSDPDLGSDPGYQDGAHSQSGTGDGSEEPCTQAWIQLLGDPSFDGDPSAWGEDSWLDVITDDAPHDPQSPSMSARLGGYSFGDTWLGQTVDVPEDAQALRLRAQLVVHVPALDIQDELLSIELHGDDSAPYEVLAELAPEDLSDSWQELTFEASGSHAGETLDLGFFGETSLGHASFQVDSVALEALVCQVP